MHGLQVSQVLMRGSAMQGGLAIFIATKGLASTRRAAEKARRVLQGLQSAPGCFCLSSVFKFCMFDYVVNFLIYFFAAYF